MKVVFLMLLIINMLLGLYLWQGEAHRASAPAALPLPELAPERIRLLSIDESKRGTAKPTGSSASKGPGAANGGSRIAAGPPVDLISRSGTLRACTEWGAFRGGDVARAIRLIDNLNATARAIEQRVEGGSGFWVYIPPLPSRRDAELRIAELKPARIDDYYVVLDEGRYANAISLGVFSTEAGAQSRREALERLGVTDAIVGPRESYDSRIYLRIRDVPEPMVPRLIALRGAFAGTDIKDCAAELSRGG